MAKGGADRCSWGWGLQLGPGAPRSPSPSCSPAAAVESGGMGGISGPHLQGCAGGGVGCRALSVPSPMVSPPQLGGAAVWGTHTGGSDRFQSGAFWGYKSIFTGFMLGCESNAHLGCHQLCVQLQAPAWDQVGASARHPQGPGAAIQDRSCPNPAPEEDRAALMETQLPYHNGDSALPLL